MPPLAAAPHHQSLLSFFSHLHNNRDLSKSPKAAFRLAIESAAVAECVIVSPRSLPRARSPQCASVPPPPAATRTTATRQSQSLRRAGVDRSRQCAFRPSASPAEAEGVAAERLAPHRLAANPTHHDPTQPPATTTCSLTTVSERHDARGIAPTARLHTVTCLVS